MSHIYDSTFINSSFKYDSFLGFIRLIIFKFQLLPIVLLVDDAVFLVINNHMEHFVIGLYLLL